MNREEAKTVLRAWREGIAPAGDPVIDEAFARLETDRVLAEWFESERTFDGRVENAVAGIPVPSDLRARILAAAPPKAGGRKSGGGKIRRFPAVLSLAASLIALTFVGVLVFDPSALEAEPDLAEFHNYVSEAMSMPADPGTESEDFAELQRYLADHRAVVPDALPEELASLSPTGANVTEWLGRVVSVVHLRDDRGQGYRLFLLPATAVPEAEELPSKPELRRLRKTSLLIWAKDGILYGLATGGSETDLLRFAGE